MSTKVLTGLLFLFLTFVAHVSAKTQTVIDGYKVVYLSEGPSNIVDYTADKFKKLGIKVYTSESKLKKDELFNSERSLILYGVFEHNYNYPHTWIRIKLYNVKQEVVYQKADDTRGKAFTSFSVKKDQRWVVDKLIDPLSKYNFNPNRTIRQQFLDNLPVLEVIEHDEESLKSYLVNNEIEPIEGIYEIIRGQEGYYYRFGIIKHKGEFKAVLIESDAEHWETGEVKAEFEKGSLKGVYATTWYMSNKSPYKTYSKLTKENILSIELPDTEGNDTFMEYLKVYPKESDSKGADKDIAMSRGSGFVLDETGLIATNAHVIKDFENQVKVTLVNEFGSSTFNTETLLMDKENDIAVIKINDSTFTGFNKPPYAFSTNISSGEDCFTIGYPLSNILGSNYKVTSGIISSTSGPRDISSLIQTTTPIQPGNSGGPLFNEKGNVIGITVGTLNNRNIDYETQNINYAIKIKLLLDLLENELGISGLSSSKQLDQTKRSEIVKAVKSYVCLIEVAGSSD